VAVVAIFLVSLALLITTFNENKEKPGKIGKELKERNKKRLPHNWKFIKITRRLTGNLSLPNTRWLSTASGSWLID